MNALFTLFFDICRFRRNPQDIPTSYVLKTISIAAYLSCQFLYTLSYEDLSTSLWIAILDTALMMSLGYAALWTRGYESRATQTITALMGTGTLITVFALVSVLLPNLLANLIILGLSLWLIAIIGHILGQALSVGLGWGIAISIIFYIFQRNFYQFLFMANAQ